MPQEQPTRLLDALVGDVLASVVFVRDYVQLDFDGPRLTAWVWPRLELGGSKASAPHHSRLGDPGYRDALCALIGRTVTGAADSRATGVVLRIQEDVLVVNPEPAELAGPEIAMLQMNDDSRAWEVWQPGHGSFLDLPGSR